MNLTQLNEEYGIADQVVFVAGPSDFPLIQVTNAHATAAISVYAGQVLSFRPREATQDLFFVSDRAYYAPGKAIKGGVPICWPWFGPDPEGAGRPSHGFVRNRFWQVISTNALPTGETQITLGLQDTEDTQALWPYAFELALEITVGPQLSLALVSCNCSDRPLSLTQALHTYFAVGDITQTTVMGLDGTQFIDKVAGGEIKSQTGAVTISSEVDRIYQAVPNELIVTDSAWQRNIRITTTGSQTAVIWNPWVEVTAKMGDLQENDYTRFICVETANAGDEVITVPAEGEYRLQVTYAIEPV
jgi:glucose-6-phosphate 1-epimerase